MPADALLSPTSEAFNDWIEDADAWFDANPTLKDSSGTGWNPYNRVKFFNQQRSVGGELPSIASYWDAVEEKVSARSGSLGPAWVPLGPGTTTASNETDQVAGRMLDIAFAPGSPLTAYAAAAGGGVWKTTDNGATWEVLTDEIPATPVGGIAVSNDDPDIIVIGTGEGKWVHEFFYSGVGILRSTDAGSTWSTTLLDSGSWPSQSEGTGFHFIEAGPADTLLAGSNDGLFLSVDSGANWTRPERLTSPAEDPWGEGKNFYDAKWQPGFTGVVFATLGNADDSENGVWRSTDNGESWSFAGTGQPTSDVGKTEIAVTADDSDRLYVVYCGRGLGIGLPEGPEGGPSRAFVSTNAGGSWAATVSNPGVNDQAGYNLAIVADPSDANTLIAGGRGAIRSTDGGDTWSALNLDPYTDFHGVRYEPGGSANLWLLGDQGVLRSTDDGQSWTSRNDGLATMMFYDIAINSGADEYWVVGGAQDNGNLRWQGVDLDWSQIFGGDGKVSAIATSGSTGYTLSSPIVFRTTDTGESWATGFVGGAPGGGRWLNPIQTDPTDPSVVYRGGGDDIYRWTNEGSGTPTSLGLGEPFLWFSLAPNGTDFWVVSEPESDGTSVHYSSDSGSTWNEADPFPLSWRVDVGGGQMEFLTPTRILAHPTQAGAALVTFSSYYDAPHVVGTTDWGDTWSDLTGDLSPQPVNDVIVNPSNPAHWFIATDAGVYRSASPISPAWTEYGTGLPHAFAFDLEVHDNLQRLAVATHGRGAWEVSIFDAGSDVVWETGEKVYLDSDLLVPEGASLSIEPGVEVYIAANEDRANLGDFPDLIEIIVQGGRFDADGDGDPIVVTTYGGSNSPGEWRGFRFDLEGVDTAYGYAAVAPYSRLEEVVIRNAQVGVAIEDVIPPELRNVSFVNIDDAGGVERHIYLDGVDVAIPFGIKEPGQPIDWTPMEWSLEAPVTIVAANASTKDLPYGESGKVDLWLGGIWRGWNATGPGPAFITIRPETRTDSTADDWGGVKVFPYGVMDVRFLDIGHAATLLSFEAPDSCVIRDSRLHHYATNGVYVTGSSGGPGLELRSNAILRGSGIGLDVGRWAVKAEGVYSLRLKDNDIYDVDDGWGDPPDDGGGISIMGSYAHCHTSPSSPDSIVVEGNRLVGPGEAETIERHGISLSWACGSSSWPFRIDENAIVDWGVGVSLTESRDIELKCNRIQDNRTGVDWARFGSSDPEVVLRENLIESSEDRGVWTETDIGKLGLGASGTLPSDRGKNLIVIDDGAIDHYITQDGSTGFLQAQNNQWLDEDIGSPETDEDVIRAKCDGADTLRVLADPTITTAITVCWPDHPGPLEGGPSLGAAPLSLQAAAVTPSVDDGLGWGSNSGERWAIEPAPTLTGIRAIWPNPSVSLVEVVVGITPEEAGLGTLSVYDVTGRTVKTLRRGPMGPGWIVAAWDGRDDQGRTTASGVYFVHLRVGAEQFTHKFVRVRR